MEDERKTRGDLKVTMHFEAYFIFLCPASDDCKILVSFICVLETGNVTLLATSSVFPEHRPKGISKVCRKCMWAAACRSHNHYTYPFSQPSGDLW